jgi:hypothetical protein
MEKTIECIICGEEVPKYKPNKTTCSPKCRQRLWRQRMADAEKLEEDLQAERAIERARKKMLAAAQEAQGAPQAPKRKRGRPRKVVAS